MDSSERGGREKRGRLVAVFRDTVAGRLRWAGPVDVRHVAGDRSCSRICGKGNLTMKMG